MTTKEKVILDCDPGHDDAISIILATLHEKIDIVGITTVGGNVSVEKTTKNALNISDLVGLDVPVAIGASRALTKPLSVAESIHGESGLDGPELPEEPALKPIDQHAVDFIIEKLLEPDGDIKLVPTGPLTNIALAMIKEPNIIPKISEIVLMGGGTFGNWTPAAEFNIWVDAEAAKVVYQSGVPIRMFGLDVTHQALATKEVTKRLQTINNKAADFVVELLQFFIHTYKEVFDFDGGPVHDACTIAYLIDPSLFEFKHVHVDIETKGEFTYGMTCVDLLGTTGKEPNVYFAETLDVDRFWDLFDQTLQKF